MAGLNRRLAQFVAPRVSRATSDVITFSDAIVSSGTGGSRSVADAITVSDSTTGSRGGLRAVTDTTAFSDVVARTGSGSRALTETPITMADVPTFTAGTARAVADTISGVSDSIKSSSSKITGADSISFSDAVTWQTTRFRVGDTIPFSDATKTYLTRLRIAEVISYSDALIRVGSSTRTGADSISFADAMTRQTTKLTVDVIPFTDALSTSMTRFHLVETIAFVDQVTVVVSVPPIVILPAFIREKAPVRLHWTVDTPAGFHARWGADDPNPENAPSNGVITTSMPGGFEHASLDLHRLAGRSYRDLEELSTVRARGAGGVVAWEGRLEAMPDSAGDQSTVSPTCVGWQAHLSDDNSAREVFVDRDITKWQGPSVEMQILRMTGRPAGTLSTDGTTTLPELPGNYELHGPSVAPDVSTGFPSLMCASSGPWTSYPVACGTYDAKGISLGRLFAAWKTNGTFVLDQAAPYSGWNAAFGFGDDDNGLTLAGYAEQYIYDTTGQGVVTPYGGATINDLVGSWDPGSYLAKFATCRLTNQTIPGGQSNVTYAIFFSVLAVYGQHGLALYGTEDAQNAKGVLASDAIGYAVGKWAPKLDYSVGPNGTIKPSAFILPHLAFLDPVTVAAMINDTAKYELLDWAVWDAPSGKPTFYMEPRNTAGRNWQARIGSSKLQETGPQIDRLWNGVIVQFTDVSGKTRTIGPPGSNASVENSALYDPDPANPVNQAGIKRTALVTMATDTFQAALQIGIQFLQQQKLLSTAGQAALSGHVQDEQGIWWPVWRVRAGDRIRFVDASEPGYRRIVNTSYDEATVVNTIQLDQPPDGLTALLARLALELVPYGL